MLITSEDEDSVIVFYFWLKLVLFINYLLRILFNIFKRLIVMYDDSKLIKTPSLTQHSLNHTVTLAKPIIFLSLSLSLRIIIEN